MSSDCTALERPASEPPRELQQEQQLEINLSSLSPLCGKVKWPDRELIVIGFRGGLSGDRPGTESAPARIASQGVHHHLQLLARNQF